jgi:uncharacterized membrane protein YphA (DoxX/SURF4 family)
MTIGILTLYVAIAALILTVLMGFSGRLNNWLVSFFQNFCGALFIFSGWVKAIDPLGTAYKLEQYFAEFEYTFSGTWFSFLAPLFPWLNNYAVGFSVFMIVFEIVLGLMLIIGLSRKFSAWAFFILVAFFTFLTGFTYLTGYVPQGANFFQFSQWGPYVETNMKVTDCGCFGDFIKLKPKVSFLKDVFLLFPAILFIFAHRQMHQLLSSGSRVGLTLVSTLGLLIYCFSNYVWDLPHTDFRPFKVGNNIRLEKALESLAENNVEIVAYRMVNKATGKTVEMPMSDYLTNYKDYPKEEWDLEQVQSEPSVTVIRLAGDSILIPGIEGEDYEAELTQYLKNKWKLKADTTVRYVERSKISDFEASSAEGYDISYELLSQEGYVFMVVAYQLYDAGQETVTEMVADSVFVSDTVALADSIVVVTRLDRVDKTQVQRTVYNWKESYLTPWVETVKPILDAAQAEGHKVYVLTAFADTERLESFKAATGLQHEFYGADDILLKTIVRSNPGLVLLRQGEVVMKWHHRKLPAYEKIKAKYME